MGRFGISQPVLRREDTRLLTGRGRFVDDHAPADTLHALPVRSPHAHARILSIDTRDAVSAPGVVTVITAKDLIADGIGAIPCLTIPKVRPGTSFLPKHQPLLAVDRARYVGECVVFVVARSLAEARDAAELVTIEWEALPATTQAVEAAGDDAPLVWDDVSANVAFEFETGDAEAVEAAFAAAARIVTLEVVNNRIVQNAIETRGAVAWPEGEHGKVTLLTGTQMPHKLKNQLSKTVLKVPPEQIRVLVHDVGGGFGGKNSLYPEQALTVYAARKLGRPVKWMGERSDAFTSDFHGRDNVSHGELALDADGRFLAIRLTGWGNLGAYTSNGGPGSPTSVVMLPNGYATPQVHVRVRGVFTNTVPTESYRGAGRPEVTYLMERLVDAAARETGIDRAELRRRNAIPPAAFPYTTPTGLTYIQADFVPVLDQALGEAGWSDMQERKTAALARGRLLGLGISNYIERCGGGGGLSETGRVRFDPDGGVTVFSGSIANGQGHETAFSQIVNEKFGLEFEKIRIVEGDTDQIPVGLGTGGSWSVPMGGGAIALASDKVIEKAKRIAAHAMEAAVADIEFAEGIFSVAGTDLTMRLEAVAAAALDLSLIHI